MSKVALIGGSGFVGSRLIPQLNLHSVINLDKSDSPFYGEITTIANIINSSEIKLSKDISTVVLLAAEHRDDVSPIDLYYKVNVQGTKNVLNAMDLAGIKNLVFTSSVAVYGLNKKNPDEDHMLDPFNHYGKSKLEAELVIKDWYNQEPSSRSVTIIRPTVIFGERNRGNVFNLISQICSRKFIMIGKGLNKKSMAYVGNIVAFIKDRIESNQKGYNVYNYSDKPDLSMQELVSFITNKMNIKIIKFMIPYFMGLLIGFCFDFLALISRKKLSISSVRIKKFCATTQFDSSKAQDVFNPPFTLEQGLSNTLDYEFINNKEDDVLFYSE